MNLHKLTTLPTSDIFKNRVIKNKDFLSLAMSSSNDGLWDWNLLTDEVYYSPRWKSMLGYKENELENHIDTWKNLVNIEDRDRVINIVNHCIENEKYDFEVEIKLKHKDESVVTVLSRAYLVERKSDGKAIRLVGSHIDITEKKRYEEFIKKTNYILELIARGTPTKKVYDEIAIIYESRHLGLRCSLLELEDGRLLHGGAPSMPKEYCDCVNGLEIGPEIGSCGASTYTGKQVIVENIETDPKWKNIKQYALPHGMKCCWSQPIINSSGKVLGAFGMYYDYPCLPNDEELEDLLSAARLASIVMERDQLQKQIKKDLRLLEEQSKLAAMGEMIGNIAHQWRQPLSTISTAATGIKLLKEINCLNDKEFVKSMDIINESAQFLSSTIEDFRSFFDTKNNQVGVLSSLELIEKTLKLISPHLEKEDIQIINNIEDIYFESLENELIQVLLNLLNNSTDALTHIDRKNRFIFINIYKKEKALFIEIKDNGGGISSDIIYKIFEPYFTTKYKSNGTGIGLHMSRDIIKRILKGNIRVENESYSYSNIKYKGAKFTINLAI